MIAVLFSALALSQVTYTKNDIKRAYQEGKCCLSTYPKEFAQMCIAELDDVNIGGHILREHYTSQDCCDNDSCTVSLDDCELCKTTATDLAQTIIGKEQNYYLNGVLTATLKHYEDKLIGTLPPQEMDFGFDVYTVIKYPSEEDSTTIIRTPLLTEQKDLQVFIDLGAVGLQSTFTADIIPDPSKCGDMSAKFFYEFDNKENMTNFANLFASITQSAVGDGVIGTIEELNMVTMLAEVKTTC